MKKYLLLTIILLSTVIASADTYKVTSAKLNVRNGASTSAKIIGSLQQGLEVEVKSIENGFACFDFMGMDGYASVKYLKKLAQEKEITEAAQAITEVREEVPTAPVSNSLATVYLFYDVKFYLQSLPVTVNGSQSFGMEGKESVSKMTGTRYTPSMRKLNVHGDGRMMMALDFTWAEKPYHAEINLDVADGGVYYLKIHMENMWNAFTKKRTGLYFKQLTQKEGLKELEDKKYNVNPDFDITL